MLGGDIPCGHWGPGRPSFSCCCEKLPASQAVGRSSFLVHEENAARVREEHPAFAGVRLLAAGGNRASSKAAAALIVIHPPAGAIRSMLWERGNQRFENERCSLTAAGMRNYLAGTRKNLLVCTLDFCCGGVNTYVYEGATDAKVHRSPDPNCSHKLGSIPPGEVIIGHDKISAADGSVWISTDWGGGKAWICSVTAVGSVILRPAGCQRQCGGICECVAACKMEIKSRHGCDVQLRFERTLDLVYRRLVRVVIIGQHSAMPWSPLPYEFRMISPRTKQAILQGVTRKDTAQKVRIQLNVTHRGAGAVLDDRNSVADRGLVPDKKKIQQLMTNHRRSGRRGVPAYEVIDRILRCVWTDTFSFCSFLLKRCDCV